MRSVFGLYLLLAAGAAQVLSGCSSDNSGPSTGSGGAGGSGTGGGSGGTGGGGGAGGGTGGAAGSQDAGAGGSGGVDAAAGPDAGGGSPDSGAGDAVDGSASVDGGTLFAGPFTCTEVIGLMTTGEWYNAGFEAALGGNLGDKWQGRFSHYGYMMEYAKPDSYGWSATTQGGVNSVTLTAACAQNGAAPDRILYQAWSWEPTTEEAWITNLEAALATIRAKRPSAKRIDLMTIIRCPMNMWCHADKPPLGPGTDRDATKQDCHVPPYVDSAFAKVAAKYPSLVSVAPKFEAPMCAANIDGIHLGGVNAPVAQAIGAHYKLMP